MDALIPLNELKNKLELSSIEGEEREGFQTLNGLLTWLYGRVPNVGEHIHYQGWRFDILLVKNIALCKSEPPKTPIHQPTIAKWNKARPYPIKLGCKPFSSFFRTL